MSFPALVKRDLLWGGLVSGAIGDVGLQLANQTQLGNTGLRPYFANQSPVVAVLRASLLTGFWSGLFGYAFPEAQVGAFLLYCGALDVLYRKFHTVLGFPDLDAYYKHTSPIMSVVFNVVAGAFVWAVSTRY